MPESAKKTLSMLFRFADVFNQRKVLGVLKPSAEKETSIYVKTKKPFLVYLATQLRCNIANA